MGVLLLCSACGGDAKQTAPSTPPGTSDSAPASSDAGRSGSPDGELATQFAGRIGACTGVTSLSWPELAQAAPALASGKWSTRPAASIATCRIEAHPLVVFSVASIRDQAALEGLVSPHVGYYSAGPGWVAAPAADLGPTPEMSLVQAAAQDLGGSILAGSARN